MQPPSRKHWIIADKITPEAEKELAAFPPLIRQILFNRKISDPIQALRYMEGRADAGDPFCLKDMNAVVDRIIFAIDHNEKIAVYGDYDVDGISATALMYEVLRELGARVEPYIPNRFDEGYGLNNAALETLANGGARLVLTVDCGVRSLEEAEYASQMGIDLIISDHHHPGAQLPDAYAVICPKQPGDEYPDKSLAGVGLAYKIAEALFASRTGSAARAQDWLDLVALGTIADIVPLTGENRSLVRGGLNRLRSGQRLGVVSLARAAGINLSMLTAGDVGFMLAPRLNAAGRIESPQAAFDLLVSNDIQQAGLLAQKLDDQNRSRQAQTREMLKLAEQQLMEAEEEFLIFTVDSSFNSGVVGLVASRLTERYHRPAVVGTWMEDEVRASCRSIGGFNITHALDECADILVRHGGHAMAAGFTVRGERLEELRERLMKIAWRELAECDLRPVVHVDAEVSFEELRPDILSYLNSLQPTGQENPEAVFCSRNLTIRSAKAVGDKTHLKLLLTDGKLVFDAIAFHFGHLVDNLPKKVDVAYHFEKNSYNGREALQLRVIDIKPGGTVD